MNVTNVVSETIDWRDDIPDDDELVLIAVIGPSSHPGVYEIGFAWHEDDEWFWDTGARVPKRCTVTHWARIEGPTCDTNSAKTSSTD